MKNLIDFFSWFDAQDKSCCSKPWLVLGKGPSFESYKNIDINEFNTFGLNHVVLDAKVNIAHIIDLDVVYSCGEKLRENADYLLLPWVPHVNNRPGGKTLEQLSEEISVLSRLAAEKRLLWYNKSGSPPNGVSPVVPVIYFSAEAPYALLGKAGVKVIRSLGIDGGTSYANRFNQLPTLLSNGQPSFDKQFREIAKTIMTYQIDASPLNMESPIKVYVATTEEQMLAVKVLEYSIRKCTSMSVDVMPLHMANIDVPRPQAKENWPRTPFSFQRFLIPQLANYNGRAIYMDSDMQVFADLRELWSYEFNGNHILSVAPSAEGDRKPQYSVMLMDCAKLGWKITDIVNSLDNKEFTYEELMYTMCLVEKQTASIPVQWNSLERYVEGRTNLVHYTDMNTQPWIYARHPFGYIWVRDLLEAIDKGFIERDFVLDHIEKGWARPSLKYQIENKIEDALLLPRSILNLDKNYSPPYFKLHRHSAMPWTSPIVYARAMMRHIFYGSFLSNVLRRIKRQLMS